MTPIGSTSSIWSLRLKGAALACLSPIGLEGDLRNLAVIGPTGSDALGAFRRPAMQQHHVRMLGTDLIELVPDQAVIVEIETAGEGDLWPGGSSTSVSDRRLAARKSRLSIIAAVKAR